jgi:hypothetical protein
MPGSAAVFRRIAEAHQRPANHKMADKPGEVEGSSAVADYTLCKDVERRGVSFYPTLVEMVTSNGHFRTTDGGRLAIQLAELAAVGAPKGHVDGSALLNQANPAFRRALTAMVQDANRFSGHIASIAAGQAVSKSELDSAATAAACSYLDVIVECSKTGIRA